MREVSRKGRPPSVSPNFSSRPIMSSMIWSWIYTHIHMHIYTYAHPPTHPHPHRHPHTTHAHIVHTCTPTHPPTHPHRHRHRHPHTTHMVHIPDQSWMMSLTFSGVSVAIMVGLSGFRARFCGGCPTNMPEWLGDPVINIPGWLGDPPMFNCPPSNVPTGLRCCGDALGNPLSMGSLRTLNDVMFPP